MAQQTAVEQLVNYMKENFHLTDEALEKLEQAKQTEREQHGKTWLDSTTQFANDARMDSPINFDDYYNKTYKK